MKNLDYMAAKSLDLSEEEMAFLVLMMAFGDYASISKKLPDLGFRCDDRACTGLMCQSCFKYWLEEEREEKDDGENI